MYFYYDQDNNLIGLDYNGTKYVYVRNLQNDIIGIVDMNGNLVVEYAYDAWGNQISCSGSMASTIGAANPFRYRGYYWDAETELYYLQSRYYDAQVGRFINADAPELLEVSDFILGSNLFAYCDNCPILKADPTGYVNWWKLGNGLRLILSGLWAIIRAIRFGWLAAATSNMTAMIISKLVALSLASTALQQYYMIIVFVGTIVAILWNVKVMLFNIPQGLKQVREAFK